ncbi:MAG: sigma 54-interacting transcriptional regulator [Anaerovorax sp.]
MKPELMAIQDTIINVAEAITAALEIETEIIDNHLKIIGGTGRYTDKIGTYEEQGNLDSGLIYGKLLKSGKEYICKDALFDKEYNQQEGELAEICCPIKVENQVLGIIGLVAFSQGQQVHIVNKSQNLLMFLNRMSELIASKLLMTVNRNQLKNKLDALLLGAGAKTTFADIIGNSYRLEVVKRRGMQVAPSDSTVLIRGESGTGKELFARAIHYASYRKEESFVSVNCGAIPEMLLESELFGYERGAFTGAEKTGKMGKFELANKGTIFLDEIGDMPLHLQVKLLSAIQNRRVDKVGGTNPVDVDVRIIAATNKNLEEMIETKQFREDLYFRLNVIPLEIPPLRERPEDIETLLDYALKKFNHLLKKDIKGFSPEVKELLKSYSWPGNVRELENVVEYAVNMEELETVQLQNLPDRMKSQVVLGSHKIRDGSDEGIANLKKMVEDYEKRVIEDLLRAEGNRLEDKRRVAELLGISESTLYRRMRWNKNMREEKG